MGRKRKRPVKDNPTRAKSSPQQPSKISPNHLKTNGSQAPGTAEISHPVISLYYRQVVTLRQYILQRIPRSSKSRRRRIAAVRSGDVAGTLKDPGPVQTQNQDLAHILDTTLVGIWEELPPTRSQARRQDLAAFSQAQSAVASQLGTDTGPASPQSEVVDFVIASVFAHRDIFQGRPEDKHLLSHGYRRASRGILCTIPNVESYYPNKNVRMLKQSPWPEVLALLGGNGDEIMLKLLLDCGLFVAVDAKKGVYCQISGLPLSGLKPIRASPEKDHANGADKTSSVTKDPAAQGSTAQGPTAQTRSNTKHSSAGGNGNRLKPNAIVFCRQRMLYARPQLGIKGKIVFGLPNHVLSRFPSSKSLQHTVHVMKYVFPRQFGLHNVCKAWSNYRDNPLFKNYSSREDEIASKEGLRLTRHQQRADTGGTDWVTSEQQGSIKIPRRLRGRALELVRQLQNRHRRCFYNSLLRYYCSEQLSDHCTMGPPSTESEATSTAEFSGSGQLITQPSVAYPDTQNSPRATNMLSTTNSGRKRKRRGASRPKVNLTDHATPAASISAFCRAVIQNLVPAGFFGTGEQGAIHQNIILRHVDRFIHMRRRESLSLHEICAGIKITQIPWLEPHNFSDRPSEDKISASDLQKRRELFHEFLYYLFDSILLPLIRGNFYVTESQVHRQRLFYFRHDVWRRLTTQPLANLRASMFEELTPIKAQELLCSKKSLGYGSLRLLPKLTGIRPIMNLKRPTQVKSGWGRQARYSYVQSVNSAIAPVHNMLNYEKTRRGDILGSGMLSVKDIHSQLKGFKKSMVNRGLNSQTPLYFVKLDIQSCFDTIPQQSLVRLIEKLVSEEEYNWMKYVEMCPRNEFGDMWQAHNQGVHSKPWRKFAERFASIAKPEHLADAIAGAGVVGKRNSVFIDTTTKKKNYSSEGLLDVLNEHVQNTLVKIGKKLFRQRNGIPQGSVMSSLLCNLFYAEMERNELGFLQTDDALFLRYVDDFLLITLDSGIAMDFLRVMLRGQPTYGVSVNPAKSLVNFAASVDGMQIPRLVDTSLFPYCGCLIETRTLDIFKDQNRMLDGAESAAAALSDSLVVDSARNPGRFFHQKVLGSVKQSLHPMYTDTAHNSLHAVLLNIFKALVGAAMKMYRYTRSLPARAHPRPEVVVRTVRDAMQLGYRLIRGQHERCKVTYHQMQYLGAAAFQFVLGRKQTRYAGVLCWLDGMMTEALESSPGSGALLAQVVRTGNLTYGGWRF